MFKIFSLFQTFYSYLKKYFIPEEIIQKILSQTGYFQKIVKIDFQKAKLRMTSPIYMIFFLIISFLTFSITLFILNIIYIAITIIQPSFNHYLNTLIDQATKNQSSIDIVYICLFFGGFKICSTIISVSHDTFVQFLGVRINYLLISLVIKYCNGNTRGNGNIITIIQEDCDRFINVPYTVLTIMLKNLELFFFVGYLISLIDSYKLQIAVTYTIYFIITAIISYQCSQLNLKILTSKQKRLSIFQKSIDQIRQQRNKQIKNNITLIVYNGVSIYLPDFTNTIVMIFIYSMSDIDKNNKYTMLIVFGLLKSTVYGIGLSFNLLAQIGTNAKRIITQFNEDLIEHETEQSLVNKKQQHHQIENIQSEQLYCISKANKLSYSIIIPYIEKYIKLFIPLFFIGISLCLLTYFSYGYFATSISQGGSVLQPLNLSIVTAQFVLPVIFYTFVCYTSVKVSRSIYDNLLKKPQKIKNLSAQQVNKLSGDLKLVDRSVGLYVHNNFIALSRVLGSLLFSIVQLKSLYLCLAFIIILLLIICLFFKLFRKTMIIRRNLYRRQVLAKGLLLNNLSYQNNYQNSLFRLYNFKQFGFLIEDTFIFSVYIIMVLLMIIIVGALLFIAPNQDAVPVVIILLMQLDSNFVQVIVSWIQYQLSLTSTERCIKMVQQYNKDTQQDQDTLQESLLTENN